MAQNNQECADQPGEIAPSNQKVPCGHGQDYIGTMSKHNHQKNAEHPGVCRAARRANIWWERPNSVDSVKCVEGYPVVRRDPSDLEGAEHLGGAAWQEVARRALSSHKGVK